MVQIIDRTVETIAVNYNSIKFLLKTLADHPSLQRGKRCQGGFRVQLADRIYSAATTQSTMPESEPSTR